MLPVKTMSNINVVITLLTLHFLLFFTATPKRNQRFTREDATNNATRYVSAVLAGISLDPLFAKPFKNAILSVALAAMLYTFVSDDKFIEFCEYLVTNMWRVVTAGDNRPLTYAQTLVTHFHNFCTDDILLDKWDELLDGYHLERTQIESDCVLQHILDKVLETIISERNAADLPHLQDIIQATKLSEAEEQVLNYVSGYIPHALLRHYKNMKGNSTAKKYVDILLKWSTDGSYDNGYAFLQYTQEWINAQNRGGLFKPNAELFLFFRALENETRNHLHTSLLGTYRDINLRDLLLKKLCSKHIIQHYWAKLVGSKSLSIAESKHLFYVTVDYFVNIRVKAFVRVYNDLKKRKDKEMSRKGSKSLRKELDSK